MDDFNKFREIINLNLQNINLKTTPKRLYQPVSYILSLGGKRLRPVLTLAACDLFGGNIEEAVEPALGIEIFHNFTLLHDDIMDRATMRRGKETVHKKWNENIAILSGDTMFAIATRFINTSTHQERQAIMELFIKTAIEVCEGQQHDMDFEDTEQVKIADYLEMIRLKTAVLLAASLKTGAIIGNASPGQAQNIYDFGINTGMAFQLKDDYLDAFGDARKFGKKIGGDIRSNKKTYLYLSCLEKASAEDKNKLQKLYGHQNTDDETEKVNQVLKLFEKYQVKESAVEEMEKYFNKALMIMQHVDAAEDKKSGLVNYARWLFQREY